MLFAVAQAAWEPGTPRRRNARAA